MSAAQLLDAAAIAMATSKSYRAVASVPLGPVTNVVNLGFDAAGNYSGTIDMFGWPTAELVVIGFVGYIRGQTFWKGFFAGPPGSPGSGFTQAEIDARLAFYADHYVTIPASWLETNLALFLYRLKATVLPDCMGVHGQLTIGDTRTFNGAEVIVVNDDGSEPAGRAATYYIAVAAPHHLLRLELKYNITAGQQAVHGQCPATGVIDATAKLSFMETIDFSGFGSVGTIIVPTDVVSGGFTP